MDLEPCYLVEALFTSARCEAIRLVETEGLGRRWVGVDKEDFSGLVGERLVDIESMFSADLEVVHRHQAPSKTVRDDGLPKGFSAFGSSRSSQARQAEKSALGVGGIVVVLFRSAGYSLCGSEGMVAGILGEGVLGSYFVFHSVRVDSSVSAWVGIV